MRDDAIKRRHGVKKGLQLKESPGEADNKQKNAYQRATSTGET